jgi:FixJ family two-component response regulator
MIADPILLVDDEADLRANVKEALTQDGYQVEVAANATAALALMAIRHYPVLLTDLNMPGGPSGFQLIEAVKASDPLTLCVVITAHASMETAIQAVKYGAYDFVQKPFKLAEIEAVLDRALDHAAVLRQLANYRNDLEDRVLARVQELNQFHQEVLKLNDLLIASQRELSEPPILAPFLALLGARFRPVRCLALLPTPDDGWELPGGTVPPGLPAPSELAAPVPWEWQEGSAEGHLIPLRSGELLLGAVCLGFQERSGFLPDDPAFGLWRRQLEAALHGLRRTRDRIRSLSVPVP